MFNSSRARLLEENVAFARAMSSGSLVLDAGCGSAPYKHLFKHVRYESADFVQAKMKYANNITYVCDLKDIPVKADRFDYIVLNQVLEHLPEPQLVLNELYRVLKPGGQMICTAPLFYQEHEKPYDFYRYTQFAWRMMLEKAGFVIERLDWMEGFFGLCGYFFEIMHYNLPTSRKVVKGKTGMVAVPFLRLLKPLFGCAAFMFHRLEVHAKVKAGVGPKNYVVIVSKSSD